LIDYRELRQVHSLVICASGLLTTQRGSPKRKQPQRKRKNMKNIYYAMTAGAAACAFLAIPLVQADDQKDKLEKAKKLEEQIRQSQAPVVSTTTKTAPATMYRHEFEPPKKPFHTTAPPSPVTTAPKAPAAAAPKAPATSSVTTSTTTAKAPSTSVSASTSTAKATTQDKPKKSEPDKK
jgi:hypothetical protein